MKQKFNIINSTCVPLPLENVDTDQIIPARFLKATTKEGFGENLFRDWRYNADGSLNEEFVLNNPTYGGQILVAGKNFGSGSSREHAAWATGLWFHCQCKPNRVSSKSSGRTMPVAGCPLLYGRMISGTL